MKRTAMLIISLTILVRADWFEEYSKRHPSNSLKPGKTLEECKSLQDSNMVKTCLKELGGQYRPRESTEEEFIYDEQTTVLIAGDETTKTVTTVKSRSGKQIAEAIHEVKVALYVTMAISVGLSLIGIIAISGGR